MEGVTHIAGLQSEDHQRLRNPGEVQYLVRALSAFAVRCLTARNFKGLRNIQGESLVLLSMLCVSFLLRSPEHQVLASVV